MREIENILMSDLIAEIGGNGQNIDSLSNSPKDINPVIETRIPNLDSEKSLKPLPTVSPERLVKIDQDSGRTYDVHYKEPDFDPKKLSGYEVRASLTSRQKSIVDIIDPESKAIVAVGVLPIAGGAPEHPVVEIDPNLSRRDFAMEIEERLRDAEDNDVFANEHTWQKMLIDAPQIVQSYRSTAPDSISGAVEPVTLSDRRIAQSRMESRANLQFINEMLDSRTYPKAAEGWKAVGFKTREDFNNLWTLTFYTDKTRTTPEQPLFQEFMELMSRRDEVGYGAYWREKPMLDLTNPDKPIKVDTKGNPIYPPGSLHEKETEMIDRIGHDAVTARNVCRRIQIATLAASWATGPQDPQPERDSRGVIINRKEFNTRNGKFEDVEVHRLLMDKILDIVDKKWKIIESELPEFTNPDPDERDKIPGRKRYGANINFTEDPRYVQVLKNHNMDPKGFWELVFDAQSEGIIKRRQVKKKNGKAVIGTDPMGKPVLVYEDVHIERTDAQAKFKNSGQDPLGSEDTFKLLFPSHFYKNSELGDAASLKYSLNSFILPFYQLNGFRDGESFFKDNALNTSRPLEFSTSSFGSIIDGAGTLADQMLALLNEPMDYVENQGHVVYEKLMGPVKAVMDQYNKYLYRIDDTLGHFASAYLLINLLKYSRGKSKDRISTFLHIKEPQNDNLYHMIIEPGVAKNLGPNIGDLLNEFKVHKYSGIHRQAVASGMQGMGKSMGLIAQTLSRILAEEL